VTSQTGLSSHWGLRHRETRARCLRFVRSPPSAWLRTRVRPLPAGIDAPLEFFLILRDVFVFNFVTGAIPVNPAVAELGPDRIAGVMANIRSYFRSPIPGRLVRVVE
jgi:hypothetical protein